MKLIKWVIPFLLLLFGIGLNAVAHAGEDALVDKKITHSLIVDDGTGDTVRLRGNASGALEITASSGLSITETLATSTSNYALTVTTDTAVNNAANADRLSRTIQNIGDNYVYVGYSAADDPTTFGLRLAVGDSYTDTKAPQLAIYLQGEAGASSQEVRIEELIK